MSHNAHDHYQALRFGIVMIGFGLSRTFWLSLLLLGIFGALDSISMVIRDVLMLTRTPDAMRRRVAAIEGVFPGSSNQLGGIESGVTAQLFGPVASVVGCGIATIGIVLAVAGLSPELRQMRTLLVGPIPTLVSHIPHPVPHF